MRLIPIPPDGPPDTGELTIGALVTEWIHRNQAFYQGGGFNPPWIAYLAVEDGVIAGTCAFKGGPKDGTVEIAYGTHTGCEGKGVATRMANALIRIARATDPTVRIIARTLPEHNNASTRVLVKCGFKQVRDAVDDEVGRVWEWELVR